MAVKKDNIKAETHQYIHTSALRGMETKQIQEHSNI